MTPADPLSRQGPPILDLVVTTVGRHPELRRLLQSVARQEVDGLRVLIADQSDGDGVADVVASFAQTITIECFDSSGGASCGRNRAIPHATAAIVAFPDDDCWYPDGFIASVLAWLADSPAVDGLLTRWEDPDGDAGGTRWDSEAGIVDRRNIWTRGNTASTFLRREVVETVGTFDESIGVGSEGPWQSGEETDYLIRAIDAGFRVMYEPEMALYHPDKLRYLPNEEIVARGRAYARGMGRVLRLRRYPVSFVALWVGRGLAGLVTSLVRGRWGRTAYYWSLAVGRLEGWAGRTLT